MIEYGDVNLQLIDGYELTKGSQTVTFSNLKADFTGHDSSDLPQKYDFRSQAAQPFLVYLSR